MTKPRIEIVLHLGAHKTATTYLQARLTRSAAPLLKNGVLFIPIENLREKILRVRNIDNIWSAMLNAVPKVRNWRTAGVYRSYLREAEGIKCQRLVISEENI